LPTITLLRFIWEIQSIFFVKSLNDPEQTKNSFYRKQYARETAGLALHWIWKMTFLFCCMPNFGTGLAFFLISELLGGFGIGAVVFQNHYPLDKMSETVWDEYGFSVGQIYETMNIKGGLVTDWVFGGLNYQIEHHLWPNLPRHHLAAIAPEVEAICIKHGIPYRAPPAHKGMGILLGYCQKIAKMSREMPMPKTA